MIVKDGTDEKFFVIEERLVRWTPRGKPEAPLEPYVNSGYPDLSEWYISNDRLVRAEFEEPHPNDPAHVTWSRTGIHGFKYLTTAVKALRKLKQLDKAGTFNWRGQYGGIERRVQHEFRVSVLSYQVSLQPVPPDEIIDALLMKRSIRPVRKQYTASKDNKDAKKRERRRKHE